MNRVKRYIRIRNNTTQEQDILVSTFERDCGAEEDEHVVEVSRRGGVATDMARCVCRREQEYDGVCGEVKMRGVVCGRRDSGMYEMMMVRRR
jgi:hypothetical protein